MNPNDHVVMLTSKGCQKCKAAAMWMAAQGVPVMIRRITAEEIANYQSLGATQMPIVIVKDKWMDGWTIKGFEEIYNGPSDHSVS